MSESSSRLKKWFSKPSKNKKACCSVEFEEVDPNVSQDRNQDKGKVNKGKNIDKEISEN
ncbi:hypothetical protein [Marinicrinis sediminis]|uniref:Cold-shock protein n=1 Tax=Marinicrinis sediminis TaxID=1652465 RepID=A0ABW5R9A0_9BACL